MESSILRKKPGRRTARRRLKLLLCLPVAQVLFSPVSCLAVNYAIECEATLDAWRGDASMKQYLRENSCSCSNGSSSPPVCTSNATSSTSSSGGQASTRAKDGGVSGIILNELKNYLENSANKAKAAEEQRQATIEEAQRINQAQAIEARKAELRKQQAVQRQNAAQAQALIEIQSQLQGLPSSDSSATLDIAGALAADARQKQLDRAAKCQATAEALTRFEAGEERIHSLMDKNDRFIRDAEAGKKEAVIGMAAAAGGAVADQAIGELQERLIKFAKVKKSLQEMKKGLDELDKAVGLRKNARSLTRAQIRQARAWLDNGLKYGGDLTDVGEMSVEFYKNSKMKDAAAAGSLDKRLMGALNDFNDKFMNDAGGWEFAGEHLAEYAGGPVGELSFRSAVLGIKLASGAGSFAIDGRDLATFRENQEKLQVEHLKLLQKITDLRSTLARNRCPGQRTGPQQSPVEDDSRMSR